MRRDKTDYSCWAVPADLSGISTDPNGKTFSCCCSQGNVTIPSNQTEDLSFLRSIASHIVRDVPEITNDRVTIDTRRIYMSGHSNGCMTSLGMAMKHSDLVAAVCCNAGSLLTFPAENYIPTPTWFSHGKLDKMQPYDGFEFHLEGRANYVMPGPQAEFNYLSILNGCASTNITVIDGGNIQRAWDCVNDANVELMALTFGWHMNINRKITSSAWEFCSAHENLDFLIVDNV